TEVTSIDDVVGLFPLLCLTISSTSSSLSPSSCTPSIYLQFQPNIIREPNAMIELNNRRRLAGEETLSEKRRRHRKRAGESKSPEKASHRRRRTKPTPPRFPAIVTAPLCHYRGRDSRDIELRHYARSVIRVIVDKIVEMSLHHVPVKGKKAKWHDKNLEIFLKVCIEEVRAGNRLHAHFNKIGWANIAKNFYKETKLAYQYKQFKNKWDTLKKEWQLWTKLIGKDTGLGWDTEKKTINANDEWWETKIQRPTEGSTQHKGLNIGTEETLDSINNETKMEVNATKVEMTTQTTSSTKKNGERKRRREGDNKIGVVVEFSAEIDCVIENFESNSSIKEMEKRREDENMTIELGLQLSFQLE
ncbi:L10-interacting MYB domain-containing protein, partial [Mucuna pruriens]